MGPGGAVSSESDFAVSSKGRDLLDLDLGRASCDRLPGAGEECSLRDSFPLLLAAALFSLLRKLLPVELCNNNSW